MRVKFSLSFTMFLSLKLEVTLIKTKGGFKIFDVPDWKLVVNFFIKMHFPINASVLPHIQV